jgi:hypothetical protein
MSTELAFYSAAKRALDKAYRVDEVKDIRDKAAAMRMYAMQAKDRVLIDQATEIRLRAERRAGELLRETEKNKGGGDRKSNHRSHGATGDPLTLSDLGINKSQSSRWQKLADIPDDDFEETVARAKQKASNAVDNAQQPKTKSKRKPKPKPEPKPKHKGDDAKATIAACLAQVKPILRDAIGNLDGEGRSALLYELQQAVRTIMVEAMAREADADHWVETAH